MPRERSFEYHGFTVYYSSGSRVVERVREHGSYEPDVIGAILAALPVDGLLLDVGANVGLVALAVVAQVPTASVVAWEPGRRQHDQLARTIAVNGLADRVELRGLALASRAGASAFSVHSAPDAPYDGLLDTGRAGSIRTVTVQTESLDDWWIANGRPGVDVVKLDTEGSEFEIVRGGSQLLTKAKPTLVIEIHPDNLRPYQLTQDDVVDELERIGYALTTLDGRALERENRALLLTSATEFVARRV
jgi:FkbM family methyltransferase